MLVRPLLLVALAFGLAACEAPQRADFDPHHRFQNSVEKRHAVATIAAWKNGDGTLLGPTDRAVVADLAREHVRRGAGPVSIKIAAAEGDETAQAFADGIVGALDEGGVNAVAVTTEAKADAAVPTAEISVPVWIAVVPECGNWPERINPNYRNQNTDNFGCSVTRNIGLMVANPADLERARDATGRSGVRAGDVLTKYGEGKATSSKTEDAKPAATLSTIGTK